MPTYFQTTDQPISIQFSVGNTASHSETILKVDFGHDFENYIIPKAVVDVVKTWPDFEYGNAESRAKLLLVGLLQYATNPK